MQTIYDNPLNQLFDIEPANTSVTEYEQITEGELAEMAKPAEKDAEDMAVDAKIDAVYDAALETFNNQMAYTEIIEPRYAARNAEVAASYLNIALSAANSRARIKNDRKRQAAFIPGMGGKVTNNTIVATREEILRMISIDADIKQI